MKQHPMFPRRGVSLPDLSKIPVFIGAGLRDPLIPPEITKELVSELSSAIAQVTEYWEAGGHQLYRFNIHFLDCI